MQVEIEVTRIAEWRRGAVHLRIECDLALGRHLELIGELRGLVAEDPLSERAWTQLITAQHLAGLTAGVLRSYERVCETFATELGIGPPPETTRLRDTVLAAEPRDPHSRPAGGAQPRDRRVSAQLLPDIGGFVGREAELTTMSGTLQEPLPDAARVCAISGMAGVGKTALAVRWAHHVRRHFPDGQLHLDLRGFTPDATPVDPAQALRRLVDSLDVPAGHVPDQIDGLAALLRSELAGKRVLMLLDNAASVAQVRAMIPAAPGCLVLVTSRVDLAALPNARALRLGVLPAADAVAMFERAADREGRHGADLSTARDVAELCGRLPLALRLAGDRLRARASWSLADLAVRLTDARWRLFALSADGQSIACAFDASARTLTPSQWQLLRALARHPGSDVDAGTAAALVGSSVAGADRLLEALVDANLLDQPTAGHYVLHPLVRDYAQARGQGLPEDEHDDAFCRNGAA